MTCVLPGLLAQSKPRGRDLGVPFDGTPGEWNAITDVQGVEVGETTLISGDNVRTGVTAVLPRGKRSDDSVFAGWFSQNGDGEMTGTTWVEESGFLDGPIMITNTHSVGVVRDAVIAWQVKTGLKPKTNTYGANFFSLPVVAETFDGRLNDVNGFHVKPEHVFEALEGARSGPVAEGNHGGGTGMQCYGFKGGTGTASRKLDARAGGYTVGALVQCNCGTRSQLMVAGVPVGREIPVVDATFGRRWTARDRSRFHHYCGGHGRAAIAPSAQAARTARHLGIGADGLYVRQQLGRYLHRILDGQSGWGAAGWDCRFEDAPEQRDE